VANDNRVVLGLLKKEAWLSVICRYKTRWILRRSLYARISHGNPPWKKCALKKWTVRW